MRAAAYTLFGSLSRFGNGPSQIPFLEQIQTNFVSLLLHLNETDPVVIDVSIVGRIVCVCVCVGGGGGYIRCNEMSL